MGIKTKILIGVILIGVVVYIISFVRKAPIFKLLSSNQIEEIFLTHNRYSSLSSPYVSEKESSPQKKSSPRNEIAPPRCSESGYSGEQGNREDRFFITEDIGSNRFLGVSSHKGFFEYGDLIARYRVKNLEDHARIEGHGENCNIIGVALFWGDNLEVKDPLEGLLYLLMEEIYYPYMYSKTKRLYLEPISNQAIIREIVYEDGDYKEEDKEISWVTRQKNIFFFQCGECVPQDNFNQVLDAYSVKHPSIISKPVFERTYSKAKRKLLLEELDLTCFYLELSLKANNIEDQAKNKIHQKIMGIAYCIENNFGYTPFKEVNKRYSKMVRWGRKEEGRKYLTRAVLRWLKANRNTTMDPDKFRSFFQPLYSVCTFEVDSNGISCIDLLGDN